MSIWRIYKLKDIGLCDGEPEAVKEHGLWFSLLHDMSTFIVHFLFLNSEPKNGLFQSTARSNICSMNRERCTL
jgi:hypothetical protein